MVGAVALLSRLFVRKCGLYGGEGTHGGGEHEGERGNINLQRAAAGAHKEPLDGDDRNVNFLRNISFKWACLPRGVNQLLCLVGHDTPSSLSTR